MKIRPADEVKQEIFRRYHRRRQPLRRSGNDIRHARQDLFQDGECFLPRFVIGSLLTYCTFVHRVHAGMRDYKYPGVRYTPEEISKISWSGKRTLTREEYIHLDRVHVPDDHETFNQRYERCGCAHHFPIQMPLHQISPLLPRYLERCEEVRVNRPDKLKDHPRPKATYHLIKPRKNMPEVLKVLEKMRNEGKLKRSPDLRVTSHNGTILAYNTDTVLLVPAMSAPCHQAALMFATGCTLHQLGMTSKSMFETKRPLMLNILPCLRCTGDAPRRERGAMLC